MVQECYLEGFLPLLLLHPLLLSFRGREKENPFSSFIISARKLKSNQEAIATKVDDGKCAGESWEKGGTETNVFCANVIVNLWFSPLCHPVFSFLESSP